MPFFMVDISKPLCVGFISDLQIIWECQGTIDTLEQEGDHSCDISKTSTGLAKKFVWVLEMKKSYGINLDKTFGQPNRS